MGKCFTNEKGMTSFGKILPHTSTDVNYPYKNRKCNKKTSMEIFPDEHY